MKSVTSEIVKKLRDCTGAGIMDCKNALLLCDGDINKAIEELKKRVFLLLRKGFLGKLRRA